MNVNDLISKLFEIEELPVSEESVGAYIESNPEERSSYLDVQNAIAHSAQLASLVTELQQDYATTGDYLDEQEPMWSDIPSDEDIDNEIINLGNMEDLTRAYHTIGEESENTLDPAYILQPDDHSCALRSQQIVLRDFGIDIPFDQLEQLAKEHGVYSDEGTYTYDVGRVLEIAGVGMHQVQGSSIYDLANELAQGHRVIVSVDANELWYNDPLNKVKNWFDDLTSGERGNHALIVAGIEVNPQDANDIKVVLTDPGAGHLRVDYPLNQFMDAWKDSNCFMAATNEPAPYQYDAETGKEVPSNFVVNQYVNEFISSHGYQLNPDMINVPADYQPAFTGHIDSVGDMSFAEFEEKYEDIVANRMPSALSIKEQIEESSRSLNYQDEANTAEEPGESVIDVYDNHLDEDTVEITSEGIDYDYSDTDSNIDMYHEIEETNEYHDFEDADNYADSSEADNSWAEPEYSDDEFVDLES